MVQQSLFCAIHLTGYLLPEMVASLNLLRGQCQQPRRIITHPSLTLVLPVYCFVRDKVFAIMREEKKEDSLNSGACRKLLFWTTSLNFPSSVFGIITEECPGRY
jgi:hypothetical protein